jgi:multiple sugar transport system substrate-binding protein
MRDRTGRRGTRRRGWAGLATLALVVVGAAACTDGEPTPPEPDPTSPAPQTQTRLTFGAYGPAEELVALEEVTANFNALYEPAEVRMRSWPDERGLRRAFESGERLPDVFMVSREDMAWLQEEELTQPVDALLDERGVDFGDDYSRDGLQAFSADDRLQCMPYGISPMVIFYNTKLVDFDRMEARGLSVPGEERLAWNFDQFVAAAEFATRPRKGTRGVYVEPSLEALAPFVYSGAGPLFDDEADPTSLAFSDDTTRDALERSLELLRSPTLTLTEQQLARRSPLAWFKRGKLGMIEGYRRMVPELRQVQGLEFDVIAMPSLEQSATIGEVTGLCLSDRAADTQAAADFMVHLLGTPSVERVARSGYLVPANLEVALSDAFLQPGRLPGHAPVFNNSVRSIVFLPLLSTWPQLENAVAPALDRLLNQPILDNLDELTEQIDEASRTVLDPEAASESASPEEQE